MILLSPCRLGEKFEAKSVMGNGRFTLTGMHFFKWYIQTHSDVSLYGKRHPDNQMENTHFFEPPGDLAEAPEIRIELPDRIIEPGCPLRELGFDSDGVGRLSTILWAPECDRDKPMFDGRRWCYAIKHGKDYGGPLDYVWSEALDEMFAPVLPLHAVALNAADFW